MRGIRWAEAVAVHLTDKECLWQDLDGLHIGEAPTEAPPTSILWAWSLDGPANQTDMVRLRIDRDGPIEAVLVATMTGGPGQRLASFADDDQRILQFRASRHGMRVGSLRIHAVRVEVPDTGEVPLTFLRRERDH